MSSSIRAKVVTMTSRDHRGLNDLSQSLDQSIADANKLKQSDDPCVMHFALNALHDLYVLKNKHDEIMRTL
ncbi:hypothetical protein HAP94_18270 [Acidithiobacillus ferrivorans]|nr:hypothetical protein [Acidithiobacillus ferrivorans]